MRILFMGTPEFAVPSLRRLAADGHSLCGVFTQPDRPKNRGHKLAFSPVKDCALSLGVPVYQPARLRDDIETIRALAPDLIAVAAYGKILPEAVLSIPPYGSVNVHSSLLPRYRGAAPIHWAVLNGETEAGVTIMAMAAELDAGDVFLQRRTPIGEDEDAQALTARLAELGAEALSETVAALAAGTAVRTPQDPALATYAPMLTRELSPVDWTRSAHAIHCQVRGLLPWPCAVTTALNGEAVKLYRVRETGLSTDLPPGTASAEKDGIDVACGDGTLLRVLELQSPGGKRMDAGSWLRGHALS